MKKTLFCLILMASVTGIAAADQAQAYLDPVELLPDFPSRPGEVKAEAPEAPAAVLTPEEQGLVQSASKAMVLVSGMRNILQIAQPNLFEIVADFSDELTKNLAR